MTVSTWNPSDKGAGITLTSGNVTATGWSGGSAWFSVRSTNSHNSGKYYWEDLFFTITFSEAGFLSSGASLATYIGSSSSGFGCISNNTSYFTGSGIANPAGVPGVSWANGDTQCWAIDFDAGKAWVGKNGTWCQSGNPAAGTNPTFTFTPGTALFAAWAGYNNGDIGNLNFGATAFAYTKPTGFNAWQGVTFSVPAAVGAFSLSGIAAAVKTGFGFVPAAGAYALTGIAAAVQQGLGFIASVGAFVLTGRTSTRRFLPLTDKATYALTGMAAVQQRIGHAAQGAYAMLGTNLMRFMYRSTPGGAYATTGNEAFQKLGGSSARGTFVLSGGSISKFVTRLTSRGTYTLTGKIAFQSFSRKSETGAFLLVGYQALFGRALWTEAGQYVLTGFTTTRRIVKAKLVTGVYALTGFTSRRLIKFGVFVGTYIATGATIILARLVAPASALKIRVQKYVLQQIRTTPPTLDE